MTVKELIKELQKFDDNTKVSLTVPYCSEEYTDKDFSCNDFWIYTWGERNFLELTTTKELPKEIL